MELRENEKRIANQKAMLETKKQENTEHKKINHHMKMQQIKESIVTINFLIFKYI